MVFPFDDDDGDESFLFDHLNDEDYVDAQAEKQNRLKQRKLEAPLINYKPHTEAWFMQEEYILDDDDDDDDKEDHLQKDTGVKDLKTLITDKAQYRAIYLYYTGEYEKCLETLQSLKQQNCLVWSWELECRMKLASSSSASPSSSSPSPTTPKTTTISDKEAILALIEKLLVRGKSNYSHCITAAKAYRFLGMFHEAEKVLSIKGAKKEDIPTF